MSKPSTKQPTDHVDHETDERDDAVIGQALAWSLAVIVTLAVAVAVAVFLFNRSAPAPVVTETKHEEIKIRERPQAQAPAMSFIDITAEAGLDFVHENGAYGDKLLPETMGGGCAFLDYDNDGDQDILFVNSSRWAWDDRPQDSPATMVLYANDGAGNFSDVTKDVGLDATFYGMGVAAADFDNDGDIDIFFSAVGHNRLFRNEGGRFADVTAEAGVAGAENAWGTSCTWFDYDRDGLLDLFVSNYVAWTRDNDIRQNFTLDGETRAYGPPRAFEGSFPYLYHNDGDGKFTDVSAEAGVQITNPATGVPAAKSMGVAPIDLDRDGWMDLVVANDTVQNFVFVNNKDGTFRETGALAGIAFDSAGEARGAMGIDTARFRDDDALGIAIGNFANEMTALYVSFGGPLQFVDAAIATGLGPQTRLELTFGVFFFDYDLDGRLDLLCSNGHLEEEINKVQVSQHYEQPPQLFWNCGPNSATEFSPVTADQCGEALLKPMVGRGSSFADIDGDGDLDVLLAAVAGPPRLLRNDQELGRNWLRVKLRGTTCNRDAIGAWVNLHVGDRVVRRQVMPTRSYMSQVELPLTFGLDSAESVDRLVIDWPDGASQTLTDITVNTSIEVEQVVAESVERPDAGSDN